MDTKLTLSDLTSRQAVLDAMVEHDDIGQTAFLAKYGFGEARIYKLCHDGREYDSKAIAGVAIMKQYGSLLPAAAFSGGKSTVEAKLRTLGFVVRGRGKPAWVRDELILALDLYLRKGWLKSSDPDVQELSRLLNRLPIHPEWRFEKDFRNSNGVNMKLANFLALDPSYDGKGLSDTSQGDREVWADFHDKPDLVAKIARLIRLGAELPETETPEDGEDEAFEGRILTRVHRSRERNRQLVEKRKNQRRKECSGSLTCEVCDFDFFEAYGVRGDGFAECHHKVPLAESGTTKTRLKDLAILCANCHRMIHVRKPMLLVGELQVLVSENLKSVS